MVDRMNKKAKYVEQLEADLTLRLHQSFGSRVLLSREPSPACTQRCPNDVI